MDIEILVPGTLPLAPQLPRGFVEEAIRPTARPQRRMSGEVAAAEKDLPARPEPATKRPKNLAEGRLKAVIEVQIFDRRRDPRSEEEE
jgi:hypothetical protein